MMLNQRWLALFLTLSAATAGLVARIIGDPANRALRRRFDRPPPLVQQAVSIGGDVC